MSDEPFEQLLTLKDEIVPSSGFSARVMDAVQREASTPPPIPFPWKWAIPGLAAIMALLMIGLFSAPISPALSIKIDFVQLFAKARQFGVEGIALSFLLTLASVKFAQVGN